MAPPFRFSRSHQTAYRKCPRLGLLRFWLDGTGYVRAGINIELGTGSLFHDTMGEILEFVLEAGKHNSAAPGKQELPPAVIIRAAVARQRNLYEAHMAAAVDEVLKLGMSDNVERAGWSKIIDRQATLAESMVRCWLIVRLPYFLRNYTLIAVEGEEKSEISKGIEFMQRKDSVWMHKENESMHSLEFKTSGNNSKNFVDAWHYDLQQITHLLNFQGKYEKDPKSVLLEIAYKGRKYQGEHVGALVSGYKREIRAGTGPYDPDDPGEIVEIEYDWVYARCKTKGWTKFWICDEDFGEEGRSSSEVWLENVLDYQTLRDHCLDTEIEHKPARIEKWLNQSRREFAAVRDGLIQLQTTETDEEFEALADILFPALEEKDSCAPYFGAKKCTFVDVCHGQDEMRHLIETQGYTARTPHHPGEHDE